MISRSLYVFVVSGKMAQSTDKNQKLFEESLKKPSLMSPRGTFIGMPFNESQHRCKRRWEDWNRLLWDTQNHAIYSSKHRHFEPADMEKMLRERYLLFVQCVESNPGEEPQNPYLYPKDYTYTGRVPHSGAPNKSKRIDKKSD
eukprot:gb/GECG01008496.1/.p1 GENE.gb/GECG01008496.1/~~gb/GECG01008496.1/.p1  ORF type:complete len:143 (+),score=12.60 gb/GECG01008496.1/:1-429(+)